MNSFLTDNQILTLIEEHSDKWTVLYDTDTNAGRLEKLSTALVPYIVVVWHVNYEESGVTSSYPMAMQFQGNVNPTTCLFASIASTSPTTVFTVTLNVTTGAFGEIEVTTLQDLLVSGTNIKTVNGTSVLGSGDITTPDTTYTAGYGLSLSSGEFSVNTGEIATQADLPQGEVDVTFNGTATPTTEELSNVVVGSKTYTITHTSSLPWSSITGKPTFATVATSGSYADLSNTPTLGTASAKDYTTSVTSGSSDLVTSGAVYTAIDQLPEPMVFKGSVGTSGTVEWANLPSASSSNEGHTYKVITAHSSSPACEVGDTIISSGSEWVVIPSGDEPSGTVTSVAVQNAQDGGLSVSGSPITSSGTVTIGLDAGYGDTKNPFGSKNANLVLASPDGSSGTPSFRALSKDDLPTLTASDVGALADSTNFLASASVSGDTLTISPSSGNDVTFTASSVDIVDLTQVNAQSGE